MHLYCFYLILKRYARHAMSACGEVEQAGNDRHDEGDVHEFDCAVVEEQF